jgi:ElaA protein
MQVNWQLREFHHLNAVELYQMLRLRSEVFVVEQQCIFLDMDNKDQDCWHLLGWKSHLLAAAARLVPPGVVYDEMSIGRVVTSPQARRAGIGRLLMEAAIERSYALFGNNPIRIGAQLYLEKFYSSLGFATAGNIYLEDGIQHVEMLLVPGT